MGYSSNVSGIPSASEGGFEPLAEEYMANLFSGGTSTIVWLELSIDERSL